MIKKNTNTYSEVQLIGYSTKTKRRQQASSFIFEQKISLNPLIK